MTLRSVLLASAMMVPPLAAANAQAVNGLYVGGGAGVNFLQQNELTVRAPGVSVKGDAHGNVGPAVVLNLGWGFGNGLRAEIEGNYRQNNLTGGCDNLGRCGGNEQKAGAMVNVLYDFVGMVPMVQPYIGAGIGYEAQIMQNIHGTGPAGSFQLKNGAKGALAYQAIVGAALPITSVPGLSLTAEYRFMGLAGDRSYTTNFPGSPVTGSTKSDTDFNHSILVGFRYEFGVAPAPMMAPMPVADTGAKTFLVFFDWDRADLTGRGEGIVREAATYSTRSAYTRIDVDGNTDTSGTPSYNQGLSERRARVVAAELVRDGVPQQNISMHAYGETKLLVPTGPNVREPQNRRVEIVFH